MLDGDFLEGGGGQLLEHGFAERLVHHQQLADRQAAGVAGLVALVAAGAPAELGLGDERFGHDLELAGGRLVGLGAIRADRAAPAAAPSPRGCSRPA